MGPGPRDTDLEPHPGCQCLFQEPTKGRSLSALLADRSIWVNYMHNYGSDGACVGDFGYKEIGIHYWVFRRGRVHVLGTLIHELAHMSGAGGSPSKAAEEALVHCGVGTMQELRSGINDPNTPYDPRLSG